MATPPDSPMEEVVFELEPTRVPKPIPVALEDLVRQTKFSRQEIRVMYRGFKTGQEPTHITNSPNIIVSLLARRSNSLTVDGWTVGSRRLITLDTRASHSIIRSNLVNDPDLLCEIRLRTATGEEAQIIKKGEPVADCEGASEIVKKFEVNQELLKNI
uniref:Uncharacterized protein n=1 Tax=Megaselia scalaris TaxID=36166 RepID=T1GTS9_MEGSC